MRLCGSRALWPRRQGSRAPPRVPTPGLSCNPSVGLGLTSTLQTQFPLPERGLHRPRPSQALLTKDRKLI